MYTRRPFFSWKEWITMCGSLTAPDAGPARKSKAASASTSPRANSAQEFLVMKSVCFEEEMGLS